MYKKLVSALGISALLFTTLAPVLADDVPIVQEQTASSTPVADIPASLEDVLPIATTTEPSIEESTTTQATSTGVKLEDSGALTISVQSFTALSVDASTTDATTTVSIDGSLTPPNGCDAKDATGTIHHFAESTSTPSLAICALEQAVSDGILSSYEITDSDLGVYLTGINGVAAGPSEYWAVYLNDEYASCGINCLPLVAGDTLSFVRTDWMTNVEYDRVDLHIVAPEPRYIDVTVPDQCSATTTDNSVLSFPEDGSPDAYLAICALVSARENGRIADFGLQSFPGVGTFLSSINGIVPSASEFWAVWLNDESAQEGIATLPLAVGDTLSLRLTNWSENKEVGAPFDLRVIGLSTTTQATSTEQENTSTGSSNGNPLPTTGLDIPLAFSFLSSLQNGDGSWNELVSDWAAFAYAVPGAPSAAKSRLTSYLKGADTRTSNVTDVERHALALMALGINPYTGASQDYIAPIVSAYDGTQIGDPSNPRDDIFGILALSHAGYSSKDPMLQSMASTIASQQQPNGSWQDVDTTAAAIQALTGIGAEGGAVARGEAYLRSMQQPDGGFYNISSTAWAIQGIIALGEDPSSWSKGGNTPLTNLGALQRPDGSLSTNGNEMNRAWEVAYAIPAAKELSWDDILHSYSKVAVPAKTSDIATSTATTTLPILVTATSTVPILPIATTTATTSVTYTVAAPVPLSAPHIRPTSAASTSTVAAATSSLALTASVGNAADASGLWGAIGNVLHSLMQFFSSLL